ncbi:MAG: sialate O-acetylesterase [Candidatus Omnitrophota bacterium]
MRNKQTAMTMGILGAIAWLGAASFADVRPHPLFSDGMVLQQGKSVPVWGTADEGENVAVQFQDQKAAAKTENGKWMVRLENLKPGGPYQMMITGNNMVMIDNILVGEVWICSGQSNMQWRVADCNNAQVEIDYANFPEIRLITVPRLVAGKPQAEFSGKWEECNPNTVANFSAVAYYFGRELHQKQNIPVGLIHTSWGGTPAESWTSESCLQKEPDFKPILDRWNERLSNFSVVLDRLEDQYTQWRSAADDAESQGKPVPAAPSIPEDPRRHPWRPSGLYNSMISPLIPYGIQGAIWYQGESNADRAYQYRKLFAAMIQNWRDDWGQGDFPFLFVQLANFITSPPGLAWAELREAQTMAIENLANVGMAVTIDIGDPRNIHPGNKQDVGKRLELAAEKIAYGQDVVYSGPIYESMNVEGNMIRLRFQHVGGGLVSKGGDELKGFAVAGEDQEFRPAQAIIDRDTVVVSSAWVRNPIAVRYAWKDNPECNLYNAEGLPASPFRTDDWPGVTADAK